MDTLTFEYIFTFPDGKSIDHKISIDPETKTIIRSAASSKDVSWTDLDFHKCHHCTLEALQNPKCPVAENLHSLVNEFTDNISYETAIIEVKTEQRDYRKETALQYGLQSMFGIIMAASGCPKMSFLSPMVLFHLPFASMEETIVRTTSFFLLNQFLRKQDGKNNDMTMDALRTEYKDVEDVNYGIIDRIREINKTGDATRNAITILNSFAQMFSIQYDMDMELLRKIFD